MSKHQQNLGRNQEQTLRNRENMNSELVLKEAADIST